MKSVIQNVMRCGLGGRFVERAQVDRLGAFAGTSGMAWLAAFLLVGCVSPPDGIDVVKGRELDDIPVKTGLKLVNSETYAPPLSEGARFRSWTGLYRGRGLMQEIGPWYVGAMKSKGWTFTGVVETKGPTFSYNFLKRDEEAVIRVYREYTLDSGRSINMVRAEVHPRGTESFLPEDLETMKATGVAWMEPDADEVDVNQEVQKISFTEEVGQIPAPAASDFLLKTPAEDLEAGDETLEPNPPKSP